jgi:WD40 repeat protein
MSLNGARMVSGDKDGIIITWNAVTLEAMQVGATILSSLLHTPLSHTHRHTLSFSLPTTRSPPSHTLSLARSHTYRHTRQVVSAHDGAVLCCSISPDGTRLVSSGTDEHIAVIDVDTGVELFNLDESLDGKGLTAKFSFDGTRVQVRMRLRLLLLGVERTHVCAAGVEGATHTPSLSPSHTHI